MRFAGSARDCHELSQPCTRLPNVIPAVHETAKRDPSHARGSLAVHVTAISDPSRARGSLAVHETAISDPSRARGSLAVHVTGKHVNETTWSCAVADETLGLRGYGTAVYKII